jgi:peptide/nickel transport system substrate-binding protein
MPFFHGRRLRLKGKALWLVFAISGCQSSDQADRPFTFLVDFPPTTLNPRASLDASSQRINALMFSALTRINADLAAVPDLAESWKIEDGGKNWIFKIRKDRHDEMGHPIDAKALADCLENYRIGKPTVPFRSAFSAWIGTEAKEEELTLHLSKPDPYLARNISLLRFFRVDGAKSFCEEPKTKDRLITSGEFRPKNWDFSPEQEMTLIPNSDFPEKNPLRLVFVQDDNTRFLKIMNGEVDSAPTVLSLTKTKLLEEKYRDRFDFLERESVRVNYLAFNLRDPILKRLEVRQAIARAIDREKIVREKLMGFATIAGSLLSPLLPESFSSPFAFDPNESIRLLESAGFKPDENGIRLRLHYKTTPVREGFESALVFQAMLKRVGIDLQIDRVEPAVFLASVRKGAFQLYSSRWLGVADGSILMRTLRSGVPDNRAGYSNSEMDRLLDEAEGEVDDVKRKRSLARVQRKMAEDLPYFPLWYWNSTVILRKGWTGLAASEISLSGAFEPLTQLKRKK